MVFLHAYKILTVNEVMTYDMWMASLLTNICAIITQNFLEVNSYLDHMPMFTTSSD